MIRLANIMGRSIVLSGKGGTGERFRYRQGIAHREVVEGEFYTENLGSTNNRVIMIMVIFRLSRHLRQLRVRLQFPVPRQYTWSTTTFLQV
ncbi:hypothetical protein DSM14862_04295 (plasmid) [Sulfitobacter indolifex]|jgi:hypothetical protein|nr:hypothetical protein DSM14862_04295 [Sulfitobacter indolifex]